MARLVDPQEGDDICDPTCGSASLLMNCGRLIRERTGTKRYALFGQEAIGSTWALAKMNLFLHGEENHQVEWGETIRKETPMADPFAAHPELRAQIREPGKSALRNLHALTMSKASPDTAARPEEVVGRSVRGPP